jgi:catechol 2,3-dioxygenase-like lactoylglutathione lyase family enzyme
MLRDYGTLRSGSRIALCLLVAVVGLACGHGASEEATEATAEEGGVVMAVPDIQATNAFYYYSDLDAAWAFYTDVLGLETVADYGFAKILQVAEASYLTLVDAAQGMHTAEEPKSVTFAFVTDEVEGWWDYLSAAGVPMRADFDFSEGRPHDGFVAIDPEGYYLEFERFNPHPENVDLLPRLSEVEPLYSDGGGSRPGELGIRATVFWLYYDDLEPMQRFYEELLGVGLLVDQGWAKIYPASRTGYIGLVAGARGLHRATEEKGVTISLFTSEVDTWFARVQESGSVELRSQEVSDESEIVRVFVGYDPGGYFLEWDTFLDVESNERLLRLLAGGGI